MISKIEEAVIQEMSVFRVTKEVKNVVAILSCKYSKIKYKKLANYYKMSIATANNFVNSDRFVKEKGRLALEKLKEKYTRVSIGSKTFEIGYIEKQLEFKTIPQVAKDVDVYPRSLYLYLNNKNDVKRKRKTAVDLEYKYLKKLGYKNASEYIDDFGAKNYRKNIVDKMRS